MLTLEQMQKTSTADLRTLAKLSDNAAYSTALEQMAHAQDMWNAGDRTLMMQHVAKAKEAHALANKGELFQVVKVREVAAVVEGRK